MWILAGLLSSCASSGKWFTPWLVLQSQPTMAVLALQAHRSVRRLSELKQSSAGAGGISEFPNPSILLSPHDPLVLRTDTVSAIFRESESSWPCHFNTAGVDIELKSWISEDHEYSVHAAFPRHDGVQGEVKVPSILELSKRPTGLHFICV